MTRRKYKQAFGDSTAGGILYLGFLLSAVASVFVLPTILASYPISYTVEFWASQAQKCEVHLENNSTRTLAGATVWLGTFPLWAAVGTKLYEGVLPASENSFRSGVQCSK